jgi:hypothetical protein
MSAGLRSGGVQEPGSSSAKALAGNIIRPSAVAKFNAKTLNPLASPSERLNRNRMMLVPVARLPAGRASVSLIVDLHPEGSNTAGLLCGDIHSRNRCSAVRANHFNRHRQTAGWGREPGRCQAPGNRKNVAANNH